MLCFTCESNFWSYQSCLGQFGIFSSLHLLFSEGLIQYVPHLFHISPLEGTLFVYSLNNGLLNDRSKDSIVQSLSYRLTNWLMFLCGQIQSPRPDVMPDRREGIARAEGFVAARIETSVS